MFPDQTIVSKDEFLKRETIRDKLKFVLNYSVLEHVFTRLIASSYYDRQVYLFKSENTFIQSIVLYN
jgi:hypothetical protein